MTQDKAASLVPSGSDVGLRAAFEDSIRLAWSVADNVDEEGHEEVTVLWEAVEQATKLFDGLAHIGRRASMWRAAKGYGLSRELIVAKLAEEAGEVARAVIGDIEERPGRGDARREAAQVVILLASLLDLHYPGPPLFDEVLAELDRMGAHMPSDLSERDNTDSPGSS